MDSRLIFLRTCCDQSTVRISKLFWATSCAQAFGPLKGEGVPRKAVWAIQVPY